MTDPITQAIEKVDAACPCRSEEYGICGVGCRCCPDKPHYQIPDGVDCTWPGHRLARELAKVSQERMRDRGYEAPWAKALWEWRSNLPLEGVEDGPPDDWMVGREVK